MSGVHESPSKPQLGAVVAKRSVHDSPEFHSGISVLEYPFPAGLTYIFSWSKEDKLSYSVGNVIQGGSDRYTTQTISVSQRPGQYHYGRNDGSISTLGNPIQGGSDRYKTQTISVGQESRHYPPENNNVTISNYEKNSPLASARTSDGNIHLFYSDNSNSERILSELIFDPNRSTWIFGSLTALGLKVHENSGIGAWSEPILKVVIHASKSNGKITEAWWDTVGLTWKSFVIR